MSAQPAPTLTVAQAARIMREHREANRHTYTWIYAIQQGEDGPIKIGVTNDPRGRLKTLQQGNPTPLRGIAAWRDLPSEERGWHGTFAEHRLMGEWFAPAPELLDVVERLGGDFGEWA